MPSLRELEHKESHIKNRGYWEWGCLLAIGTLILLVLFNTLLLLIGSGALERNPEPVIVSSNVVNTLVCCLPLIAALIVNFATPQLIRSILLQRVRSEIRDEKDRLETQASLTRLGEHAIEKLNDLQSSIKSLTEQLQVPFPAAQLTGHSDEIQRLISAHGAQLLTNSAPLDELVVRLTREAEEDNGQLEKTLKLFQAAMSLYNDTRRFVIKTGSNPLIHALEDDEMVLRDSRLKALIPKRRWDEHRDVVNSIIADLQMLRDRAINYQSSEEQEFEEQPIPEERDEDKAYRILGVPPTTTLADIEKMLKGFKLAYHPDNASEANRKLFEERLMNIEWAVNVLKRRPKS